MATTENEPGKEQAHKLIGLLCDHGYSREWFVRGRSHTFQLEFWARPGREVLLQIWDRGGVDVFHAGGIPLGWDEFESWLDCDDRDGESQSWQPDDRCGIAPTAEATKLNAR